MNTDETQKKSTHYTPPTILEFQYNGVVFAEGGSNPAGKDPDAEEEGGD